MREVTALVDPCPLPNRVKRTLNEKDRLIYAPMSDVGSIFFDKDAMYINLPSAKGPVPETEGEQLLKNLQGREVVMDILNI